jgi:uncharacterized membrane protein
MQQEFTPMILIHLSAALVALVLGIAVFLRRKGNFSHRVLGRAWVGLMLVTAISTYWIRGGGHFSWIHGLSVISLVALSFAMYFAMTGNILRHQRIMKGVFFGGLVVAGAFTLLPARLLGQALWSSLGVI